MDTIKVIEKIVDAIKGLYTAKKEKDNELFCYYIEEAYLSIEKIYINFRDILSEAIQMIEYGDFVENVVKFLNRRRFELLTVRSRMRATLKIDYYANDKLYNFYLYSCGVMQGGMSEITESRIIRGILPGEKNDELRSLSREHTLLDLIERYDDEKKWGNYYYTEHGRHPFFNQEYRLSLLEDIRHQLYHIDLYWDKLSNEYAVLKYEKLSDL